MRGRSGGWVWTVPSMMSLSGWVARWVIPGKGNSRLEGRCWCLREGRPRSRLGCLSALEMGSPWCQPQERHGWQEAPWVTVPVSEGQRRGHGESLG